MADSDHEIELAMTIDHGSPEPSAPATTVTFLEPPAPTDDLSFIQSLVDQGAVVGSLPPIEKSAKEKRAEVEAAMATDPSASLPTSTLPTSLPTSTVPLATSELSDAPQDLVPQAAADEDNYTDSSSEFESDDEAPRPLPPRTAAEHAALKAQLDAFVGHTGADSDSDSDSEESEYDLSGKLGAFGMEIVDDSDDDVPAPITSAHEVPLPPVPQPPVKRLPEGVKLVLAGDVVSWMKDKAVEGWRGRQEEEAGEKEGEEGEEKEEEENKGDAKENAVVAKETEEKDDAAIETDKPEPKEADAETTPAGTEPTTAEADTTADVDMAPAHAASTAKLISSGTVIIRALHAGASGGWLEADSILCYADGRVLGVVTDTFGPLTSPFYLVRLPPPPFPYPSPEDMETGAKIYFPADNAYRTFVDMHAVRDPRFKSDASNVYDEEVGDEEVEWSDDEAEAAAKRRKKKGKGKKKQGQGQGQHGLPARPHFDYADDLGEGGMGGDEWEMASEAGSERGEGRRLVTYDDDPMGAGSFSHSHSHSRGRGGRGGRGGQRGGGRGGPRGGGGSGGSGGGQGRPIAGRAPHALPPRPNFGPGGAQSFGAQFGAQQMGGPQFGQQMQGYMPYAPAGYNPGQPSLGMPTMPFGQMPMGMGMGGGMGGMPMGMGGMPMGMGGGMGQMGGMGGGYRSQQGQQQQGANLDAGAGGTGAGAGAPAINPRFAHMMGMGYWPQNEEQQ